MIIAIPVDKKAADSAVCASFGRAHYFMIFDTNTKESVFLDNAAAAGPGGAGIKAAQTVIDHKAEAVLAPRVGGNAADVLEAAGVKIYQTTAGSAAENLEAFAAGDLALLQDVHPGFRSGGGR